MTSRIYKVVDGDKARLVRASNRNQAIGYCARNAFKADVATQDDILELAAVVTVEDATKKADAPGMYICYFEDAAKKD